MAELLIQAIDKVNTDDFYADSHCMKRGDVLNVCENGWGWGDADKTSPDFRILAIPNAPVRDLEIFLVEEFEMDPYNLSKTLQRRMLKLDLDNFPEDIKDYILDEKRIKPIFKSDMSIEDLLKFKIKKKPIPDPVVFGDNPNIF